jgi:glucosylceramidase
MNHKQNIQWVKYANIALGFTSPLFLLIALAVAGFSIDWLGILIAGIASLTMLASGVFLLQRASQQQAAAEVAVESDTVDGIMTSATKKHTPIAPLRWSDRERPADIKILPRNRRQNVLGFGAALTGSSCKVFERMPGDRRDAVMRELFHPARMNLNVSRVTIGASDYHPELYSYSDEKDPSLEKFSIAKDRPYVLPIIQLARQINPDMYLFASPWSPPGWMKPIGTMLGGNMGPEHFKAYAKYFAKYLKAYQKEGIKIQAVTVQNEVEADQGGKMPACTWTRELECEFVRDHLGPTLISSGFPDVKIWMMDHNYDMEKRAIETMDDEGVREYCDAIAWHGYGGSADAVGRVHDALPDVEHHFTEFNTFLGEPPHTQYLGDWTFWGAQIGEAMRNWIRDYVMWNVALDEEGKPNIGPFNCGGVITVNSQTHEVMRSGGYWGLGHYSRFVKRDAYVVESIGSVQGLTHVAFINPDGSKVLVLTNAGDARSVSVEYAADRSLTTDVQLDANSVTTLFWR